MGDWRTLLYLSFMCLSTKTLTEKLKKNSSCHSTNGSDGINVRGYLTCPSALYFLMPKYPIKMEKLYLEESED